MDINVLKELAIDLSEYTAEDVLYLELMSIDELSEYLKEVEKDAGNLSGWDHLRHALTMKYENIMMQKRIDELEWTLNKIYKGEVAE